MTTAEINGHPLQLDGRTTLDDVLWHAALHIVDNDLKDEFQQSGLTVTQWLLARHDGLSVEFLRSLHPTTGRIPKRQLLEMVKCIEHGGRYL